MCFCLVFLLSSVSPTGAWDIKGGATEADSSGNWSSARGSLSLMPKPCKPVQVWGAPLLSFPLSPVAWQRCPRCFASFFFSFNSSFSKVSPRIASPLAFCFRFCRCGRRRIKLKTRQARSKDVLPRFLFLYRDQEMCLRGALLACWVQPYYFICLSRSCNNLLTLIVLFPNFSNRL